MPADIFGRVPSPPGTIAYWDDDPANLPAGWVVCDGNNGTPNLLSKFMKHVPDSSTEPGTTGGQDSYSMIESQAGSHSHGFGGTDNQGDHSHNINQQTDVDSGSLGADPIDDPGGSDGTFTTGSGGSHSHGVTLQSSGSGSSVSNIPSSHKLVPVIKT